MGKLCNKKLISAILVLILTLSCMFTLTACFDTIKIEYVFMDEGVEFQRKTVSVATFLTTDTVTYNKPDKKGCRAFAYWQVEDAYSEVVTVGNNISVKTETLQDGTVITFSSLYIEDHDWSEWEAEIMPTEDEPEGLKIRRCNNCEVIDRTSYYYGDDLQDNWDRIIDKANSKYGYNDIKNNTVRPPTKVDNMVKMYRKLETVSRKFFKSESNAKYDSLNKVYYLARVDISDCNLTRSEMLEVYMAFTSDTHLYYFISKDIVYTEVNSSTMNNITLVVDSIYYNGLVRKTLNETILEYIRSYETEVKKLQYDYQIASYINKTMISKVSYSIPNKPWAHNILGVAGGDPTKGPVCESYAKTYNMLLNYYGVETIYVTGDAGSNFGEPHAWNLIKLDGSWYWVDPTWNDTNDNPNYILKYFAVGNGSFLHNHRPTSPGVTITNKVVDYMYKLPTVSDTNYNRGLFV